MKKEEKPLFVSLKKHLSKKVKNMDKKELLNQNIDTKEKENQIKIKPNSTILFIGDSITDVSRDRMDSESLGSGFPILLAADLLGKYPNYDLKIYNRGISGNKVIDLRNRWESDCLNLNPDVVTILIGINDVWHLAEAGAEQTEEDLQKFEDDYRYLLKSLAHRTDARVVLMEPFVLPYPKDRHIWRKYLDPRIHIIRRIANDYHTALVPLDGLFNAKGIENTYEVYTGNDGVHPTLTGHKLIADAWKKHLNL